MSLNGPPTAAICWATGVDIRLLTTRTTPKHRKRPARNAALITRMRTLRAVMTSPLSAFHLYPRPFAGAVSQAGRDPCQNRLIEHRTAVMRPQRQRSGEQHAEPGGNDHKRPRKPVGRRCGYLRQA